MGITNAEHRNYKTLGEEIEQETAYKRLSPASAVTRQPRERKRLLRILRQRGKRKPIRQTLSKKKGHEIMKKYVVLLLIVAALLTLASCGSKDALAGTWSADFEYDGTITWTFNGKGKCTMENAYIKQSGTYSIDGDQLTVTLETWDKPSVYTFSVDGSSLTLQENSGYGISGTFAKK